MRLVKHYKKLNRNSKLKYLKIRKKNINDEVGCDGVRFSSDNSVLF